MAVNAVVNLVPVAGPAAIHIDEAKDINDGFEQVRFASTILPDDNGSQSFLIEIGLNIFQVLESVDVDTVETLRESYRTSCFCLKAIHYGEIAFDVSDNLLHLDGVRHWYW